MNHSLLSQAYDRSEFIGFIQNFLPDFTYEETSIDLGSSSLFRDAQTLGHTLDGDLTVLEVSAEAMSAGKRIAITKEAFSILRDHGMSNALIAFNHGRGVWRLSLLTTTLKLNDKGKITSEGSNPRRYSYLLGIGAKTNTPRKFLIDKGRVGDIKQLQERFSVEVVNKQFYASVAELFTKLVGGERGVTKYPGLLKINGSISQNVEHQEFAVRLIGRIIFSWFLKEKKSAAGVPIVPNELLSLDAVASNADYYHSILEPLFFELLNKRVENRHENLREEPFSTVPYLNGGLFSPQHDDYYNQNSFNGAGTPGLTHIPDSWFTDLFTVLEQYNFTVDENTSYDVDLSIDPEMLGRIFENLLAEINPETGESARKSTGSFYTPREIVEYMVDSSLLEFLKSKTSADEDKLKALISWGQEDDKEHELTADEKQKVVNALAGLTILDPACGSGAFPIGVLQKVVYILQQADPRAEVWLENQLKSISSPELKRDIQEKYESENYDWLRKYGVIRETIFGVDIQTIATEISKLRCFLTLIIEEEVDDEKPNRGVHALPNLDFKFVTANSLVGLPRKTDGKQVLSDSQAVLFEEDSHIVQLKQIRAQYFGANSDERARLQIEFKDLQHEMFRSRLTSGGGTSDLYNILSDWNPFKHRATDWFDSEWMFGLEGFDIVIANPPYFQLQKYKSVADALSKLEYATFSRSTDIYCIFFEMGLKNLNTGGILTYITSNSWLKTKYGKSLRKMLTESYDPRYVINFDNAQVFETAVVESSVSIIKNDQFSNELMAVDVNIGDGNLDIAQYFKDNASRINMPDPEGWIIGSDEDYRLRQKIEQVSVPLKQWNQHIYIGLLNGLNEAYVIDTATRDRIVAESPSAADIIKPMLQGRDVQKYQYDWPGTWIINAHNGIRNKLPRIDVENDYPAVFKHLLPYKEKLEIRKNRGTHWTNLRNCAYFDEFNKPKIIWGELSDKPKFAYDDKGYVAEATLFALVGENLKYLLGILNSRLALWYFQQIATSSGMGTNRWKKYKIEGLPIARITENNEELVRKIEEKVNNIIDQDSDQQQTQADIETLVYRLYNLTPEEIAIVEASA